MRVEELKNYGKGLLDLVPDTEGLRREEQINKTAREELHKELGLEGAAELMSGVKGELERMKSRDWSEVRNRGLTSQKFLSGVIRRIALMKSLADMVGLERASARAPAAAGHAPLQPDRSTLDVWLRVGYG